LDVVCLNLNISRSKCIPDMLPARMQAADEIRYSQELRSFKSHVTRKLSVEVETTFSCVLLVSLSVIVHIIVLIFTTYLGVKV
jgi:hypothetical protein